LRVGRVLAHPFVIGELALGSIKDRAVVIAQLGKLPRASTATDAEVLALIEAHALHGAGIGYVDAHLLAATMLTPTSAFLTRDKRLHAVAQRLGIAAPTA